jgi:hypothetical protein
MSDTLSMPVSDDHRPVTHKGRMITRKGSSSGLSLFPAQGAERLDIPPEASPPLKLETRGPTSHSSHKHQQEFWQEAFAFWASIIGKLDSIGRGDLVSAMRECHQWEQSMTCKGCGKGKVITNRCEIRWCPLCSARLARERVEELKHWSTTLRQPKHVILTSRNSQCLTKRRVRLFQAALAKLRRLKGARNWQQGTWSLEVTNEGRGWHLHAHLLVEADWIDSGWLALSWAKLIGQDFAIVKVKDARAKDYLQELLKYVVKSSEMASWPPEEIAEFMTALKGRRSFGVFGKLCGRRREWRLVLRSVRDKRNRCSCGCNDFTIDDARLAELQRHHRTFLKRGR